MHASPFHARAYRLAAREEMQGARSSERTDLQGGRAAPRRGLRGTGGSPQTVGAGSGRFAGRQRCGRSLAGLGAVKKTRYPEFGTEWSRRKAWGAPRGGNWAQGQLTWVTGAGPGTLCVRCAGPVGPSRARMPRQPSSVKKNGSGKNPRHLRLNPKCSLVKPILAFST